MCARANSGKDDKPKQKLSHSSCAKTKNPASGILRQLQTNCFSVRVGDIAAVVVETAAEYLANDLFVVTGRPVTK